MGIIFNQDFRDFLVALRRHEVRYVLVGGYSVILHGYSRTTGDRQNPVFPGYMKLEELEKDATLYTQLGPLVTRVMQLGEQLLDTQILAGSEAYVTALMIYRLAESAAKVGLPGADTLYQTLCQRFVAQGTPAASPPAPAAPKV